MEIIIRRLEAADVSAVAAGEKECFAQPWSERSFREALEREDLRYIVAQVDGKVAGHCGVYNVLGEGEIINVAVYPDYRGHGLSKKMLEKLLEDGRLIGVKDYTLEVRAGNGPAIHVYEQLGFVTEGVRPGFYDFPKEDALIMWLRENGE